MVADCNADSVSDSGGDCHPVYEVAVCCVAEDCKHGGLISNDGHGLGHGHSVRDHRSGGHTSRDVNSSRMFRQSDDPINTSTAFRPN